MLYKRTETGDKIPFRNTKEYRLGLQKDIDKLKKQVRKQVGQEDFEYMMERQTKLWLSHEEPSADNPFPGFNARSVNHVVTRIRTLSREAEQTAMRANDPAPATRKISGHISIDPDPNPKMTECDN